MFKKGKKLYTIGYPSTYEVMSCTFVEFREKEDQAYIQLEKEFDGKLENMVVDRPLSRLFEYERDAWIEAAKLNKKSSDRYMDAFVRQLEKASMMGPKVIKKQPG